MNIFIILIDYIYIYKSYIIYDVYYTLYNISQNTHYNFEYLYVYINTI